MDYAAALRVYRAARGMSLAKLAKVTGFPAKDLSAIERGKKSVGRDFVESFAAATKTEVAWWDAAMLTPVELATTAPAQKIIAAVGVLSLVNPDSVVTA